MICEFAIPVKILNPDYNFQFLLKFEISPLMCNSKSDVQLEITFEILIYVVNSTSNFRFKF